MLSFLNFDPGRFAKLRPHWRVVEFALFMMFIGPLIAPYFSRVNDPMYQAVAAFIFKIGAFICPQPTITFQYGGMPYAVCYRCLAALFGLIIARWLHRPGGALYNWPMRNRLIALAVCVLWLEIDLQFTNYGIWQANVLLMIIQGVPYGMSVGAVCFAPLVALDRRLHKLHFPNRQTAHRRASRVQVEQATSAPDLS